jgi:hypothetical protein
MDGVGDNSWSETINLWYLHNSTGRYIKPLVDAKKYWYLDKKVLAFPFTVD